MTTACEKCQHWVVSRATLYGNGERIERWRAPDGKGACASLGIETDAGFSCNRFIESFFDHVDLTIKPGAPWEHFVMIDCPDCGGKGDGGRGHRCAGTGKVRLYDDGYVGDEQTRRHPKEPQTPPKCPHCSEATSPGWKHCPKCGSKLWGEVAETEVIPDAEAGLVPYDARQRGLA